MSWGRSVRRVRPPILMLTHNTPKSPASHPSAPFFTATAGSGIPPRTCLFVQAFQTFDEVPRANGNRDTGKALDTPIFDRNDCRITAALSTLFDTLSRAVSGRVPAARQSPGGFFLHHVYAALPANSTQDTARCRIACSASAPPDNRFANRRVAPARTSRMLSRAMKPRSFASPFSVSYWRARRTWGQAA